VFDTGFSILLFEFVMDVQTEQALIGLGLGSGKIFLIRTLKFSCQNNFVDVRLVSFTRIAT
jgi:hypothetical protein